MHESSLADQIIKELDLLAQKNSWTSLKRVEIQVGRLSGFQAESLQFCLESIKNQSDFFQNKKLQELIEHCDFSVIEEPVILTCCDCGWTGSSEPYSLFCQKCSSFHIKIVKGKGLYISKIEQN